MNILTGKLNNEDIEMFHLTDMQSNSDTQENTIVFSQESPLYVHYAWRIRYMLNEQLHRKQTDMIDICTRDEVIQMGECVVNEREYELRRNTNSYDLKNRVSEIKDVLGVFRYSVERFRSLLKMYDNIMNGDYDDLLKNVGNFRNIIPHRSGLNSLCQEKLVNAWGNCVRYVYGHRETLNLPRSTIRIILEFLSQCFYPEKAQYFSDVLSENIIILHQMDMYFGFYKLEPKNYPIKSITVMYELMNYFEEQKFSYYGKIVEYIESLANQYPFAWVSTYVHTIEYNGGFSRLKAWQIIYTRIMGSLCCQT